MLLRVSTSSGTCGRGAWSRHLTGKWDLGQAMSLLKGDGSVRAELARRRVREALSPRARDREAEDHRRLRLLRRSACAPPHRARDTATFELVVIVNGLNIADAILTASAQRRAGLRRTAGGSPVRRGRKMPSGATGPLDPHAGRTSVRQSMATRTGLERRATTTRSVT